MPVYGLRYRPAGFATLPQGWHSPAGHPAFRFGTVTYDVALPPSDVEAFELTEIATAEQAENLARELAGVLTEYVTEWVQYAENEPRYFACMAGTWLARRPYHVDVSAFIQTVYLTLKANQKSPPGSRS